MEKTKQRTGQMTYSLYEEEILKLDFVTVGMITSMITFVIKKKRILELKFIFFLFCLI